MTRKFVAGLVTVVGLVASAGMAVAAEPVGRYAIVVKKDVAAGSWGKVVRSLEAKYNGKAFAYFSKVILPGETIIWDAGKGLKVGDQRSVTFTARRVRD